MALLNDFVVKTMYIGQLLPIVTSQVERELLLTETMLTDRRMFGAAGIRLRGPSRESYSTAGRDIAKTHLAVKRTEAEAVVASALRAEKVKRYLAIVRNVASLYDTTPDKSRKEEFLTAERELWLLGDQELVRKLRIFLVDITQEKSPNLREQLFGNVVLEMRRGLGVPVDRIDNEDFRFHSA